MSDIVNHYHQNAANLSAQYDALTFEQVHTGWLPLLDKIQPARALDIGAGSGRDAEALARRGWQVTAVEPAEALRKIGQKKQGAITWLDDRMPALAALGDKDCFDLILLSAVWMHLTEIDRPVALKRLQQLLSPQGILIISLRHGPSVPGRAMYPVSVEEMHHLASPCGLTVSLLDGDTADCLQRSEVSWQTVVLKHRK